MKALGLYRCVCVLRKRGIHYFSWGKTEKVCLCECYGLEIKGLSGPKTFTFKPGKMADGLKIYTQKHI